MAEYGARTIYPRQCRAAREVLGIPQAEAAAAIGVSASTLSLFERGKRQLSPNAMARLIAFFEAHRVTFWLDARHGVFFIQEDGSLSGAAAPEAMLRC